MATLPREVLKWLQSLDLSYSVKNPRRDFSNGFLIAEIFSRYFQYDISLHSYDNGSSLQKKIDNWAMLDKFFRKRNISIPKNLIDSTVHSKDEAAHRLVEHIYSMLTARNLETLRPLDTGGAPGYLKPTATSLINENIRDSEAKNMDLAATAGKAAAIVEDHDAATRQHRRDKRAAADQTADRHHARVETRQLGTESDSGLAPSIQFDAVKVKAVDKSVSELRQSIQAQTLVPSASQPQNNPQKTELFKSVNSVLGSGLVVALQQHGGPEVGGLSGVSNDSLWPAFIENLETIECRVLTAVLDHLSLKHMPQVVDSCLRSPREFWQLTGLLLPSIHKLVKSGNQSSQAGKHAPLSQFLKKFAAGLLALDPGGTWDLFVDFGLTKVCELLRKEGGGPGSSALLSIVYSFCPDTISAHIAAIKALQDSLNDQPAFMLSLAGLIELESRFDDDLLDLYLYYCVVGLGMTSPRLQAAALSMLPTCAQQQPALVLSKMSLISCLAGGAWWEVDVQLVLVAATLVEYVEPEQAAGPIELLTELLSDPATRRQDLLKVAACALAPCMVEEDGVESPTCRQLSGLYVNVLLALSSKTVSTLLDVRQTPTLSVAASCSTVNVVLSPPALQWSPTVIALALTPADPMTSSGLKVLLSLEKSEQLANDMLDKMGPLFISGLCDPDRCELVKDLSQQVMTLVALGPSFERGLVELAKALVLVFPNGAELCRETCLQLVDQIGSLNQEAMITALQAEASLLEVTELCDLLPGLAR